MTTQPLAQSQYSVSLQIIFVSHLSFLLISMYHLFSSVTQRGKQSSTVSLLPFNSLSSDIKQNINILPMTSPKHC